MAQVNRPHYETNADLAAERAIANAWASRLPNPVTLFKLPSGPRYGLDFVVLKGHAVVAVIEVKDRKDWKMHYGNVILGMSKVRELFSYHKMGTPAYFIVRLPQGIFFVRINEERINRWIMGIKGRTDRNDKNDKEPCYRIPFGDFTKCNFPVQ